MITDTATAADEQAAAQDRLFDGGGQALDSNLAAMQQIAKDARQIYQRGGRLSAWQQKILRECAFYELRDHVWPDRHACAADLKQHTGWTYNALDKAGCPWGDGHRPVPIVPVLRWAVARLALQAAQAKAAVRETAAQAKLEREADEARLRRLKAQAEREEHAAAAERDRFRNEALDEANRGLTETCLALRATLTERLPADLAEQLQGKDAATIEQLIRTAVTAALEGAATQGVPHA